MKSIKSRILGETQVDENQLLEFDGHIFGFEHYNEFYLLDWDKEGMFKILQSAEDENLSFVVISPEIFFPWYKLEVHDEDLNDLSITKEEDGLVFLIVTIPKEMKNMTANLQGPIVINKENKKGKQCVALNEKYTTRHRLFEDKNVCV